MRNRATELLMKGDIAASRLLVEDLLRHDSNNIELKYQLGIICLLEKNYSEALSCLLQALHEGGLRSSDHWHNFGLCLREAGYFYRAIDAFARALKEGAGDDTLLEKGHSYLLLGEAEEAASCFAQLLHNSNTNKSSAYFFHAMALQDLNQPFAAISSFEEAIKADGENSSLYWHFGRLLISVRNWEKGWTYHECRIQADPRMTAEFREKRWRGETLLGKSIVLWPEQGLGDILQFCRFAPVLANMGASVYLILPQALAQLIGDSLSRFVRTGCVDIEVIVYERSDVHDFDFHCPLMSLPYALEVNDEKLIPYADGYLVAPARMIQAWGRRLGVRRGLRVGIVWGGHSKHNEDAYSRLIDSRRSIPLRCFKTLLNNTSDIEWVSLQKGAPRHQLTELIESGLLTNRITDLTEQIADWSDTAALLHHLDLVITVDTSVAHLAGAMGKPVWMLSRLNGCWRWLKGRSDTPWYRSMRIFHQTEDGNWTEPIEKVAAALDAFPRI